MTVLYHFTEIQRVPSIMRQGLQPRRSCHMVGFAPVVWLTEQLTRRDFPAGTLEACREHGWRGSATWLCDQSVRLAVSKPNVSVIYYLDWLQRQPLHEHFDMWFARQFMSKWWIAFAPISPDRISVGAAR